MTKINQKNGNGNMEVAKTNNDAGLIKKSEGLLRILSTNPLPKEIQINRQAGGSKYLPVSFVETKLDEIFFGLWQTRNFQTQVVANKIVGIIELGLFHPVLKEWIWRTGAGAVMIQQQKGSEITDIGSKHKNTLVKDYPHLKTECLKNAARSLGKAFGRDLNRDLEDTYAPLTEEMEQKESALDQISKIKDNATLNELWKDNPDWQNNSLVLDAFLNKRKELTT